MKRVEGQELIGGRAHAVHFEVKASAGFVRVKALRNSRQRCAGDIAFELTESAARDLLRALQGRADEAKRLAYVEAKKAQRDDLTHDVERVALALGGTA